MKGAAPESSNARAGALTRIDRVSAPGVGVPRGRFAPSPTGPLHIGSLLAAIGSYLAVRRAGGEWLVRIEDIDPPREVPGAADRILRQLEAAALHWDSTPVFQHERFDVYREVTTRLLADAAAFECSCTRSEIRAHPQSLEGRRYPGTCRTGPVHPERALAARLRVDEHELRIADRLQGTRVLNPANDGGDFVIRRRDGLPAYHLAVVVDDAWQGITEVVRGTDLLDSTVAHRILQQRLGLPEPAWLHLPVIRAPDGQKLSKQTGAAPVAEHEIPAAVQQCLALLGLPPPDELHGAAPSELLAWAVAVPEWRCPRELAPDGRLPG